MITDSDIKSGEYFNESERVEESRYWKPNKTQLNSKEVKKIATIKDSANNYEAPSTRNIADLEVVRTDLELEDRSGKDSSGDEFKYKVIIVEEEEYRVPGSVLGNLKAILKENSELKTFKVTKTGTGMNTKYTVIPLA